jgi:hypothetical protein
MVPSLGEYGEIRGTREDRTLSLHVFERSSQLAASFVSGMPSEANSCDAGHIRSADQTDKLKRLGGHPHPPNPNGRSVR